MKNFYKKMKKKLGSSSGQTHYKIFSRIGLKKAFIQFYLILRKYKIFFNSMNVEFCKFSDIAKKRHEGVKRLAKTLVLCCRVSG